MARPFLSIVLCIFASTAMAQTSSNNYTKLSEQCLTYSDPKLCIAAVGDVAAANRAVEMALEKVKGLSKALEESRKAKEALKDNYPAIWLSLD